MCSPFPILMTAGSLQVIPKHHHFLHTRRWIPVCSQGEQPLSFCGCELISLPLPSQLPYTLPSFVSLNPPLSFRATCSLFCAVTLASCLSHLSLSCLALSNSKGVFEEKWLALISMIQRYFCQQYKIGIEEASKTTQCFKSPGLTVINFTFLSVML